MEPQSMEEPATAKEEWKGTQESTEWPTTEMEDINQPTSDSLGDHSESTTTTTDRSEISALPSQQPDETGQELSQGHGQVVGDLQTQESSLYSMESEPIREEEKPAPGAATHEALLEPEQQIACEKPKKVVVEQGVEVKQEPLEDELDEDQQVADEDRATNEAEEEEEKMKEEEQQDGSPHLEKSGASANNNSSGLDLTKGNRNSRDDYDAFTTATPTASSTRCSNRRSTTDSTGRPKDDDRAEVLESKYCRKCSSKTAHDIDGGCQACLYKKIVESSKKQRPSSQKGARGPASSKFQQLIDRQHQQQTENSTIITATGKTTNISGGKRRAGSKQPRPRKGNNVINNNVDNIIASNNNNIQHLIKDSLSTTLNSNNLLHNTNILPINNNLSSSSSSSSSSVGGGWTSQAPPHSIANVTTSDTGGLKITITRTNSNEIRNSTAVPAADLKPCIVSPRLDSWSPDEVANYILSKGFAQEAESFKTQSVDGISLLLMQRTDFTYGLKIKLGPALKIYDQVCKLKKEYFQSITIPQL